MCSKKCDNWNLFCSIVSHWTVHTLSIQQKLCALWRLCSTPGVKIYRSSITTTWNATKAKNLAEKSWTEGRRAESSNRKFWSSWQQWIPRTEIYFAVKNLLLLDLMKHNCMHIITLRLQFGRAFNSYLPNLFMFGRRNVSLRLQRLKEAFLCFVTNNISSMADLIGISLNRGQPFSIISFSLANIHLIWNVNRWPECRMIWQHSQSIWTHVAMIESPTFYWSAGFLKSNYAGCNENVGAVTKSIMNAILAKLGKHVFKTTDVSSKNSKWPIHLWKQSSKTSLSKHAVSQFTR